MGLIKVSLATLLFFLQLIISFAVHAMPDSLQVNEERIVYWQEKRLGRQLSEYEKQAFLTDYLKVLGKNHFKPITPIKFNHKHLHKNHIQSAPKLLSANGNLTEVKVLAILIDFPDLPFDSPNLSEDDTDMLYDSYSLAHYRSLMFSDSGYAGPNDEQLMSAKQYYAKASGNSFDFTGDVYGWVRADNSADTYGKREGQTRDVDVQSLVIEAVEKVVQQYNIDLSEYDKTDLNDLDGDGNLNEPDGVIDHLMLFHSSIGEEAGGGALAGDAIWSHRFFVTDSNQLPHSITGSDIKAYNYTINPIDAGIGVVVHEFAHDLGLPDEYDLNSIEIGEPVANWSVMSSGSWTGELRGSEPVMFSPKNLEFLQSRFGGKWLRQQEIDLLALETTKIYSLAELGVSSNSTNQIKVSLPNLLEDFIVPIEGNKHYYSGEGNNLRSEMSYSITLPKSNALILTMLSQFHIERDYDVFQVLVNGQSIPGNLTKKTHPNHTKISNYLDGASQGYPKSIGNFVQLEYDLTSFSEQTIELSFLYQTDAYTNYFGLVLDEIKILNNGAEFYHDNAEQQGVSDLQGFRRIGQYKQLKSQEYYLQLRSHNGLDRGLKLAGYSPGVLLWFGNDNVEDNTTSLHPGKGQILVVDTDQRPIYKQDQQSLANSTIQVRDAALGLEEQLEGLGDQHLSAISSFLDTSNFLFSEQPQSGVHLPKYGFGIELNNIEADHKIAEISLSYQAVSDIEINIKDKTVSFSPAGLILNESDVLEWQFGDNSTSSLFMPEHTFELYDNYLVTFKQIKENGEVITLTREVKLTKPLSVSEIESSHSNGIINTSVQIEGGVAPYQVSWDFGDGTVGAGVQAEHSYSLSGSYTINVLVVDSSGQQVNNSLVVTLAVPLKLTVDISTSNLQVSAIANVTGGSGKYTLSWDMGDGSVLQGGSVSHNYSNSGNYEVKLTVTDTESGKSEIYLQMMEVSEPKLEESTGGALIWLIGFLGICFIRRAVH